MTSIITELCNGSLGAVGYTKQDTPEVRELERLMEQNLKKLQEGLNENEVEILRKYKSCIEEYMTVVTEQSFCCGFCVGTRILAEAVIYAEQII